MTDKEKAEEYYEDNECYSYLSEVEDFEEVFGFVEDRIKKAHIDGLAEGRKEKWHSILENPNDLPPVQEYEINGNTGHWKWYLVKTDYTNYKSCHYAICARVLMPRYSDGVDEPIWKENSGNDIGDEHIFEWKEL